MILNCKFKTDEFSVKDENVLYFDDPKFFRYTFWKRKNNMNRFYSKEAIDLLYLSFSVYAADRLFLREDSEDGWKRNIKLFMPVLNIKLMNENKKLIEKMLNFLSGDAWEVTFRRRNYSKIEKANIEYYSDKVPNDSISKICMLSGGLDSTIGAIDLLYDNNPSEILFCSHYGGGKGTKEYQDKLISYLVKNYKISKDNFYQNYVSIIEGKENTTRTRSFMFFSHAIVYASALNKQIELIVPENGLISLNIPLAANRSGTNSTRTTHPYYMGMLQELINNLGINVKIKNPYQFNTKGEMIKNCKDKKHLQKIINSTMSCSHPDVGRYHKQHKTMHCGYCLPCTIRRAAIKKGGIFEKVKYFDEKYNKLPIAKQNLLVYKKATDDFDEKNAFLKIQESGPIEQNIKEYSELYKRGMKELKKFIKNI